MPLSEEGKKVKRNMDKEYDKEKSDRIFYSMEHSHPEWKKAQWWADRLSRISPAAKAKVLENIKVDGPLHWWLQRMLAFGKASEGHGGFLVTDEKGNKHLPTKEHGKTSHRLLGAAWAALHGGYRGNKYEGPNKSQAISKLKKLYQSEGLETPSEK